MLFRSSFTRPSAEFSTKDAILVNVDAIITSPSGRVKGTFSIPDPKISSNPQFRTGQVSFRLTSSPTNIVSTDPVTAGETNYSAVGILQTEQETIIATRNAELRRISVSQSTEIRSEIQFFNNDINDSDIGDGSAADASAGVSGATSGATGGVSGACTDPLAQTFLVDVNGGMFVTSVDLFFESKDDNLPVTVEVREVQNGFPGPRVIPFGRVVKDPDDVVIDSSAQTATNFKFESPVYLQNGLEYCIAVLANVPTYKVWIARMGETEVQSTLAQAQVGGTADAAQNVLFSDRKSVV